MSNELSSMPVIDVDSHWTEPRDLWTSRAPQKFKDRVLRVAKNAAGVEQWVVEDDGAGVHLVEGVERDRGLRGPSCSRASTTSSTRTA